MAPHASPLGPSRNVPRAWSSMLVTCALVLPGVVAAACNSVSGVDDVVIASGGQSAAGGASSTGTTTSGSTSTTSGSGGSGNGAGHGGSGGVGPDPCAGVTCSDHGSCFVNASQQAECDCEEGYHDVALSCALDESCDGVDCGRCSACELLDGIATCTCGDGFVYQQGYGCTPSPDPCDAVDCGVDRVCISEHHCVADAVCVDTCDCSNCGDCDMQDFVDTGASFLYCGGGQAGPATMACTRPCPNGGGCIPYSTPICWSGQGCMSL